MHRRPHAATVQVDDPSDNARERMARVVRVAGCTRPDLRQRTWSDSCCRSILRRRRTPPRARRPGEDAQAGDTHDRLQRLEPGEGAGATQREHEEVVAGRAADGERDEGAAGRPAEAGGALSHRAR